MKIVIPAREGSKGLPYKNRKLFKYTADIIPEEFIKDTYIFSDDIEIIQSGRKRGFKIAARPHSLSIDTTSTTEAMEFFTKSAKIEDEVVIVLYLTYPERTWDDVKNALDIFNNIDNASSLLCKKKIHNTPFLMLKKEGDFNGSQLFHHDLYRRQDYPECFEISHYICMFRSNDITKLNNNMYSQDTVFIDAPTNIIDVDTQKDIDIINERFNRYR
jgi:CMP-N,N'-diacetyllegionaminic acid synthase